MHLASFRTPASETRDGTPALRREHPASNMPSVYIETLGCQMNEADSRYIADRARSAGYTLAPSPEDANVVVLNTCTVRDAAERRAYGRMNHFNALKRQDPGLRLIVTGCLAEQDRDVMRRRAPQVDAVFGTRELAQLGAQLAAWQPELSDAVPVARTEGDGEMLRFAVAETGDGVGGAFSHLRAFVTVQRGCSYYCTFCIVPQVRGRFEHRPQQAIVEETIAGVMRGAREVVLVGQTVNAWRDPAGGEHFGDLCRAIANVKGLERLTFISPHPKDFTNTMLDDLAGLPQLNPRIHLPLQSASDPLLRRMNRKYTLSQFHEKVRMIRERIPDCAITTDIIVGFPGENESDFRATLGYVAAGVFANAFTFIYSVRRGTPAARWEQVPREIALERFERLLRVQNGVTEAYHKRKVGSVVRALVAGDSKKDSSRLTARTTDNVTVVAPKPPDYGVGSVGSRNDYRSTPWLDVAIDAGHVWGCTGRIVRRAGRFADAGSAVPPAPIDLTALAL